MLPPQSRQFQRHLAALENLKTQIGATPAELVYGVLLHWKLLQFPRLIARRRQKVIAEPAVLKFAEWLAQRPILDSAFWLSSSYAALVGAEVRAANAMFFTPPGLAERVIDSLLLHGASLENARWHDPAGGGGAFLAPLAARMIRHAKGEGLTPLEISERINRNITARELDSALAKLATEFVRMIFVEQFPESDAVPEPIVQRGDSLRAHAGIYDVVVCNPPYRKLSASELKGYRSRFSGVMEGQSNLYGLFMARSLELVRPAGLAALLTPTSFLSGLHFEKLRAHLSSAAAILQVDLVHDRLGVFIGVEQRASATVLQRRGAHVQGARSTAVACIERGKVDFIGSTTIAAGATTWLIPRQAADSQLVAAAQATKGRLSDYGYEVKVGGFVAYRDRRRTYKSIPQHTDNVFPLIWAADVHADGRVIPGRAAERKPLPVFVKNKASASMQSVESPALAMQRVTSPDQPKRLVVGLVLPETVATWGGVVGENHVLFLIRRRVVSGWEPERLLTLLRTAAVDRVFRAISGVVNVSVHELEGLPLPMPADLAHEVLGGDISEAAVCAAYATALSAGSGQARKDEPPTAALRIRSAEIRSR